MQRLDKIFNPVVLLALNVAIILGAEFVGGGNFFYDSGLIHAIAVLFILLAAARIFFHRYVYDQYLEKFIHFSIAAFIVFALSHLIEFYTYEVLKLSLDTVFANVANFYAVSLILFALGAESFLSVHDKRRPWLLWLLGIILAALSLLVAIFLAQSSLVSLEITSPIPLIYVAAIAIIGAIACVKIFRISTLVSISSTFSGYMIAAIVLIMAAVLPNIFYEPLQTLGFDERQVIYISHFIFYAALSLMFLAFRTFSFTGIYSEAEKLK